MVTYAWTSQLSPKLWSLQNEDTYLNLASAFTASRGTYVVQYDLSSLTPRLSIISHQNDNTGLSLQLLLTFKEAAEPFSAQSLVSTISVITSADGEVDFVTLALPY